MYLTSNTEYSNLKYICLYKLLNMNLMFNIYFIFIQTLEKKLNCLNNIWCGNQNNIQTKRGISIEIGYLVLLYDYTTTINK